MSTVLPFPPAKRVSTMRRHTRTAVLLACLTIGTVPSQANSQMIPPDVCWLLCVAKRVLGGADLTDPTSVAAIGAGCAVGCGIGYLYPAES
jgi:hypothetical protein